MTDFVNYKTSILTTFEILYNGYLDWKIKHLTSLSPQKIKSSHQNKKFIYEEEKSVNSNILVSNFLEKSKIDIIGEKVDMAPYENSVSDDDSHSESFSFGTHKH